MAQASGTSKRSKVPAVAPGIPLPELPKVYRAMLLARLVDERCLSLQRQGRIGFYAPLLGQEGAQVACAWALDPSDWLFPAYRELAVAIVRGLPLRLLLDQFIGNSGDVLKGRQMPNHYGSREHRFVPASSPVGTQIIHAVGAAMAAQRRKDAIVTVTFFGDGTTSSNDFHSGLNFAGVFQTPTIFFCQNNQWAISMPRERQTHSKTLAMKAAAYGIEGVVVDGEDVHAVYRAVREARDRAVQGGGPTLIEAQVYRLGPHSTSDDPRRYRSDAELEAWKARDSVTRVRAELIGAGALTEESDAKLVESLRSEISHALAEAESSAPMDPLSLFDDVFAGATPRLEEERAEFSALLRDGVIRP
ncbi:MAG TPA: thiamine pyrophosphate-dependent dehydrogenase E1 component subunit alpha [Thermoplasmata archaeon]|nr:thiamine pyrophosphate-dependent dehydrogenase E1 component subunit alpha [Thermoplasmata archaeon]